jgi:hypothetical protein
MKYQRLERVGFRGAKRAGELWRTKSYQWLGFGLASMELRHTRVVGTKLMCFASGASLVFLALCIPLLRRKALADNEVYYYLTRTRGSKISISRQDCDGELGY